MTISYRRYIGFKEYIDSQEKISDTPEGDFIKDAQSDSHLPDFKSWKELKSYFFYNHVSEILDDVLVAAKVVWLNYRAKYPLRM